jgi:hypothetical protein
MGDVPILGASVSDCFSVCATAQIKKLIEACGTAQSRNQTSTKSSIRHGAIAEEPPMNIRQLLRMVGSGGLNSHYEYP